MKDVAALESFHRNWRKTRVVWGKDCIVGSFAGVNLRKQKLHKWHFNVSDSLIKILEVF